MSSPVFDYYAANILPPYSAHDHDLAARGIRDKPRRYRDHMRHWLDQTAGMFSWSGLPDHIPPQYLEQVLQLHGWAALIDTPDGLQVAAPPSAAWNGKFTPYYLPAGCIVSNPYAVSWNKEYTYGQDAVLCRNAPSFASLQEIISPRVEMQTETDVTILCALQNLRIINLIKAKDDKAREAAELFLRRIAWGRSGIVTAGTGKSWSGEAEESPLEALPLAPVPGAYMQQMIEVCQYIRASLYNDLGIQSNWNAKREALSESEVGAGQEALRPLVDIMLKCRQDFCGEVSRVFGLDISVELAGAWAQRAQVDEMEEAQAEAEEAIAEEEEAQAAEIVEAETAPEPEPVPESDGEEVQEDDAPDDPDL